MARRRVPTCRIVTFGVTSGVATDDAIVGPSTTETDGRVVVEADAPHDDGVAPDDGGVDAVVGRQLLEARVRPPPHRGAGGVVDRVGGEDDDVGADVGHVADVEVIGGDGRATHHEPPSIVLVRADDHAPVRQPRGRPRGALDPRVVAVGPQRLGRTGRGVGAAHLDAALVPGMQGEERPVVVPRGLRQVGEVVAVPAQLGARAVEPKDPRRDLGVRGARGGVGDLGGRPGRDGPDRRSTSAGRACRRPALRGGPSRPAPTRTRGTGPSPRRPRTPPPPSAPPGRLPRRARGRTSGSSSSTSHRRRPSVHATRVPVGSGRGSMTALGTGTIEDAPVTRSATTSCPASAAAATTWEASVA